MKKQLLNSRLFRYFRSLIHDKNPGNRSDTEQRKVAIENNLRWQDDGGPVVDTRPVDAVARNDSGGSGKDS